MLGWGLIFSAQMREVFMDVEAILTKILPHGRSLDKGEFVFIQFVVRIAAQSVIILNNFHLNLHHSPSG